MDYFAEHGIVHTISALYHPQARLIHRKLFSIYINEIADMMNCGIVLYADDTVIYQCPS